jgi:hypothetical protein
MIDIEGKFLFIHIPRTNGSEFCNWYYNNFLYIKGLEQGDFINYFVGDPSRLKHFTYTQCANHFTHLDLTNFDKMSIVRNPFDTTVSNYWMHVKLKSPFMSLHKIDSFSEYVKFLDSVKSNIEVDVFQSMRILPYIDQCHDVNVIRYENYDNDISALLTSKDGHGLTIRHDEQKLRNEYVSRYGSSERPVDYKEMYDQDTKDLVGKLFKWDLKVFEYDF